MAFDVDTASVFGLLSGDDLRHAESFIPAGGQFDSLHDNVGLLLYPKKNQSKQTTEKKSDNVLAQ